MLKCRQVEEQFTTLFNNALVLRDATAQVNCFGLGKIIIHY